MFQNSELGSACANVACPNRPGEGKFVIVETLTAVVGGHRPIRLYMCGPCTEGLRTAAASAVDPDPTEGGRTSAWTLGQRIATALNVAQDGQLDGAHHKMWVIDQMVRCLTGDNYARWVADYERGEAEWDRGIAP